MVRVYIPRGDPACVERVRQSGIALAIGPVREVAPLDLASAEDVWLIPDTVFASDVWPRLRVDLNRAPRFFLVALEVPDPRRIVDAMRDGAFDVLTPADDPERWGGALLQAAENQRLWLRLYAGHLAKENTGLVGCSVAINDLRRDLQRLGPTNVTVLIEGESGVGKECVAMALHESSRGGPLVTLNCAAVPRELLEAELFGAERGAFTGAFRDRAGLVEQASGGMLFLDEVGELDLGLQPKLLRFLETRRARRIGGETEYTVDVRVVAATNQNLEQAVAERRFRADLFYRLAEVILRIPPLRERWEDVPGLVRTFLGAAAERFGKHFDAVEPDLLVKLQTHSWPGNVRELRSVVDRLVLFHDGPVLRAGWWEAPPRIPAVTEGTDQDPSSEAASGNVTRLPNRSARLELARRLLAEGRLPLGEIAARAGVHPTTLFRWRKSGKTAGLTQAASSPDRDVPGVAGEGI